MKDYKEGKNFIFKLSYGNTLFPCQDAFEKYTTKTELCKEDVAANALALPT